VKGLKGVDRLVNVGCVRVRGEFALAINVETESVGRFAERIRALSDLSRHSYRARIDRESEKLLRNSFSTFATRLRPLNRALQSSARRKST
jgi:hypothetical protein